MRQRNNAAIMNRVCLTRGCLFPAVILVLLVLVMPAWGSSPGMEKHVIFLGDTAFGESYHDIKGINDIKGDRRYQVSFRYLGQFLRKGDIVVANLETPLTLSLHEPRQNKAYLHWGHPARTGSSLKDHGITAVSLANNHSLDYGVPGLEDTFRALEAHGIAWFGAGMDLEEASRPYYVPLQVGERKQGLYIFSGFQYFGKYDREYHFYASSSSGGVNPLDMEVLEEDIKKIREDDPLALVVCFPHWGANYVWRDSRQKTMAYDLVDAGVDLVIGHGAHMMQEIERYGGSWIVYGLGNFIFNSPGRYAKAGVEPFSIMADLVLWQDGNAISGELRLYPIMTDNYITRYQGRPLDHREFEIFKTLLADRGLEIGSEKCREGKDERGYYLSLQLD